MYLIARKDPHTGIEKDWLVQVSLRADLIQVTTARQKARRFKSEADAHMVRNQLAGLVPADNWKVVKA